MPHGDSIDFAESLRDIADDVENVDPETEAGLNELVECISALQTVVSTMTFYIQQIVNIGGESVTQTLDESNGNEVL
jgi:hypothetical protein